MTLPPLQVFAPGGSAGGTAGSPAGPRVTARPVSKGWTRSACRAWGRCRRAGSCPSGEARRLLRSGHGGPVLGGLGSVGGARFPAASFAGHSGVVSAFRLTSKSNRLKLDRPLPVPRQALSQRRPGGDGRPRPLRRHHLRFTVPGRTSAGGPLVTGTVLPSGLNPPPHIRRRWRCPQTHLRPPKCVPPQSKGCASVPCTPMAQPRTRWGRTHSQRQLTPNAHDVPRVGTRKPKTQSKLSPERRHS